MKKLYLIDAAGYLYRSYFAIRNMTNEKGESTNALFGFTRSLLKFLKDLHPDYAVAVFDGPDNSRKRVSLYPNYKAHRAAMPPDLLHQINWAKELCALMGISTLAPTGVEADDTIGSIAIYAEKQGADVYLCTTDKDLSQLVSPHVFLLDTFKENAILDAKGVEEKFGVPPHLIPDYLALTGDSSDNVPGVPGIGPKTAAELLKQFGSLDAILAEPEKLSNEKKRALFNKHKEDALISRKLVLLDTSVEFPREDSFFLIKPIQKEALKAFYGQMKFNSLIRELESKGNEKEAEAHPGYHLVDSESELKNLLEQLQKASTICIDTETTGLNPFRADLVGIGLGVEAQEAWYIPLNGRLGKEKVVEALKPFLGSESHAFYGHNLKYDYHVLAKAGLPIRKIAFDTLLASYLLNTHSRRHSLDELSVEHFGFVKTPTAALIGKGKQQISMAEVPIEKVAAYCCEDVDYTIRLKDIFLKELEKRGLKALYDDLELPLLKVLAEMEEVGIYLDVGRLQEFGVELGKEIQKASEEIYALAGEVFNLNSPLQISQILFKKLQLPAPKGTSTSSEVLEALKWNHPIAGKIQEYRVLEKLRSTYVEVLPLEVNPDTHRIHCTFNQSVAATGRLSCQDPNLQNIPVRTDAGLKIREAFRPEKKGWSYISADYSQIELRLLAHLSEDPILLEAFQQGKDIHSHTAATVFHVPLEKVTKEMRARAKAVNFGVIYGQGAYGLSQSLGISQKEAADFIHLYFKEHPQVKSFLELCKDRARLTGKAVTLTGRERALPEILSRNIQIRNAAERLAVNTPFQGSAADLIKMAMLEIQKAIASKHLFGKMILQIHDELIFEVPDEEIEVFKLLIHEKMEHVMPLKVPLAIHLAVGKNWKEC